MPPKIFYKISKKPFDLLVKSSSMLQSSYSWLIRGHIQTGHLLIEGPLSFFIWNATQANGPLQMQVSNKINPDLLKNIKNLPVEEQSRVLDLLKELQETEDKEAAREGFMPFIKKVWPAFIEGRHHKIMAEAFERVANGDLKRLIINMPPRHTKSEFA